MVRKKIGVHVAIANPLCLTPTLSVYTHSGQIACAMSAALLRRLKPLSPALRSARILVPRVGAVFELDDIPELPTMRAPTRHRQRVLVRECDMELHDAVCSKRGGLLLMGGERGTGKTTSMRSAVGAARRAGAVVLYIPHASVWTFGGGIFAPARGEEGKRDDRAPIRWYDRPTQTAAILQTLLNTHGRALESVPCEGKSWDTARQAAEEGIRLVKTVDDDWRLHPRRAGHALSAIIEALAAHKETRFVVAVDEYEALTGLTELGNGRGRWVHSNSISLVGRHLGRDKVLSFAKSISNGMVVLACGNCGEGRQIRKSRVLETTDFPLSDEIRADPSGRIWRRDFWQSQETGKKVLHYKRFAFEELRTLQGLQGEGEDRAARMRAVVLSGGRADVLHKLNASL